MENNKKYFIVPIEYAEELDLFTNEQLGELFRSLLHYSAYGTDSDSNSFPIKLMYRMILSIILDNFSSKTSKRLSGDFEILIIPSALHSRRHTSY